MIDKEEEKATGGSLTGPLDTVLNECNGCAENLFKGSSSLLFTFCYKNLNLN